jgi:hypothetical protein
MTRLDTEAALQLSESISLAIEEGSTTIFDDDGTVPVHIIRPGIGKGRGKHLYEANMLASNAHKFTGWRMYVDHQSPEARRAAGGLPRSVRDLGGRIVESKWDPTVPADPQRGYGAGAVVGRAKPVKFVRDLIEDDPALIEASISASATGVHPVNHQGQRVWCVEGINDRGSVDWVTEAGAGGRVAPLIEASYASEEAVEMALLESMSDDEVLEFLRTERPNLNLGEADSGSGASDDDSDDDMDPEIKKLMGKGMSRAQAEKFAKNIKESAEGDMPITAEQLQEALSQSPELLTEALTGSEQVQQYLARTIATALQEERAADTAERDAVIDRQWELRDLRDIAHNVISEARIPGTWKADLKERFNLDADRKPTRDLDVVDDIDDDGAITKTAAAKLTEAVKEACKKEQHRLAEVSTTRVYGQGSGKRLEEGEDGENTETKGDPGFHTTLLQEAGIDLDKAYAGI